MSDDTRSTDPHVEAAQISAKAAIIVSIIAAVSSIAVGLITLYSAFGR